MKTTFHCQTLMQKQRNKNNMYRYIKLSVLSALVFNSSVKMSGIDICFKSQHFIEHLCITIQFVWLGQEKKIPVFPLT
jgi:hypothetical protein